jgi:hypothetical protein
MIIFIISLCFLSVLIITQIVEGIYLHPLQRHKRIAHYIDVAISSFWVTLIIIRLISHK